MDEQIWYWPGNDWPPSQQGQGYAYTWFGDDYWEDEFVADHLGTIPQEHMDIDRVYTGPPRGPAGQMTQRIVAETLMELKTGGPDGSSAPNLWRIFVGATNYDTLQRITSTIVIRNRQADTNGDTFHGLLDNATYQVTPHVPGEDNYFFGMAATKGVLKILRDETNVTGLTSTVVVGEKITLSCVLDPAIATITNFQWSVPGNRIKDFYVSSDELHTNGWPVALTNADLTNQSVLFAWVDGSGGSLFEVQCTAIVKGITLTAKSKFNVIRPSADWTGQLTEVVAVDDNHPFSEQTGYTQLHFGLGTNHGITFNLANVNINGYSGGYSFSCVQKMNTVIQMNLLNNNNQPPTPFCFQELRGGLDGTYPYKLFGQTNSGTAVDSPTSSLLPHQYQLYRQDSAEMVLFFQPTSPSIPVPLRTVLWNWSGKATNQPPWQLVSSPTYRVITGNNLDTTQHPSWTSVWSRALSLTTTNTWCP